MNVWVKVLIGVVVGVAAVAIYGKITKKNIVEKIKEALEKKKASKVKIQATVNNAFAALVKEIQKDSVSVDVFFGQHQTPEVEEIQIRGVAKDIKEGDLISLID